MFPSEMVILMAIAAAGDSSKKLLTRPMDISGEYIGYLYDSLVKRGYLKKNGEKGYRLTTKGKETLFVFLQANNTRVKDTINLLQQLGIEKSREIEELGREAIKVK